MYLDNDKILEKHVFILFFCQNILYIFLHSIFTLCWIMDLNYEKLDEKKVKLRWALSHCTKTVEINSVVAMNTVSLVVYYVYPIIHCVI